MSSSSNSVLNADALVGFIKCLVSSSSSSVLDTDVLVGFIKCLMSSSPVHKSNVPFCGLEFPLSP